MPASACSTTGQSIDDVNQSSGVINLEESVDSTWVLCNNSTVQQSATVTFTYTSTVSSTISFQSTLEIDVGVKYTAGVPKVASGELDFTVKDTYTTGESLTTSESQTFSVEDPVQVPPFSGIVAKAAFQLAEVTAPTTATITNYTDCVPSGTTSDISGTTMGSGVPTQTMDGTISWNQIAITDSQCSSAFGIATASNRRRRDTDAPFDIVTVGNTKYIVVHSNVNDQIDALLDSNAHDHTDADEDTSHTTQSAAPTTVTTPSSGSSTSSSAPDATPGPVTTPSATAGPSTNESA